MVTGTLCRSALIFHSGNCLLRIQITLAARMGGKRPLNGRKLREIFCYACIYAQKVLPNVLFICSYFNFLKSYLPVQGKKSIWRTFKFVSAKNLIGLPLENLSKTLIDQIFQ